MSRSYKHTPYSGDKKDQFAKRYANRKVRRFFGEMPFGNWFKKLYESWDICDYSGVDKTTPKYEQDQQWKKWFVRK